MVPEIMSLVANERFNTGIRAVKTLSSMPGKIPIKTGSSMTIVRGDIWLWASLNDFANIEIAMRREAKKMAKGSRSKLITIMGMKSASTKKDIWAMLKVSDTLFSKRVAISGCTTAARTIPKKAMLADVSPDSAMTPILPMMMWRCLTGDVSNVSRVPRSFSPAPKSMAGYMHPVKQKRIKI
jgi:hypothetical protein